ncbi:MAG: porin [Planctomycetales bacterium]|nr:porin [Planctomycetales bacterium]
MYLSYTRFSTALLIGITCVSCWTQGAHAQDVATPPVEALQAQIDGLRSQLSTLQETAFETSTLSAAKVMPQTPDAPPVPACLPAAKPASEKKSYPEVRVTGFFQADAVWFGQDGGNIAAVGDLQDGADFRRTRLAATGDVAENVGFIIEMDYSAPGRPNFMDVWAELREGFHGHHVRVGQFRHPFGMEGLTGVRDLTFLERGLPFAFLPFRQIGAMTYGQTRDEAGTWAISGFRFPTDAFGGNIGDFGGYGLALRGTRLLYEHDESLVHVGGGYGFIDPSNDLVRYRNQPEIFVVETGNLGPALATAPSDVPPFVDTGDLAARHVHLFNTELAAARGPITLQSEVFFTSVNRPGMETALLRGAYAQASYVLTGESHAYQKNWGVFGRVVPDDPYNLTHGIGAWEIAGRWSFLDLDDAGIEGGQLTNYTVGLNWYLNRFTKVQFNYIRANLEQSPVLLRPRIADSAANIYAVRLQLDF